MIALKVIHEGSILTFEFETFRLHALRTMERVVCPRRSTEKAENRPNRGSALMNVCMHIYVFSGVFVGEKSISVILLKMNVCRSLTQGQYLFQTMNHRYLHSQYKQRLNKETRLTNNEQLVYFQSRHNQEHFLRMHENFSSTFLSEITNMSNT